jgi:GT2 family glycosyltransferase
MKTAVIIPNWNGDDFLKKSLFSLTGSIHSKDVIVVDNGSTDGSIHTLKSIFPEIGLIQLDRNFGFAGGVNRGIQKAIEDGYDFVALFNNDAIAEKDWLEKLVERMEMTPKAAIVTSKILHLNDDKLDSTGDFYSIFGFSFPRGRDELDTGQYDHDTNVFAASGGASLYRVSALKEIGFFDESFFAYYEDVDISFRARLAGWEVLYEPAARVRHAIGGTSSKHGNFTRYHTIKNFFYLFYKNMPAKLYWKYFPKFVFAYILLLGKDILKFRLATHLHAVITAFAHLPEMTMKRREIQKSREISVSELDALLYKQMPPTQKAFLRMKDRLK